MPYVISRIPRKLILSSKRALTYQTPMTVTDDDWESLKHLEGEGPGKIQKLNSTKVVASQVREIGVPEDPDSKARLARLLRTSGAEVERENLPDSSEEEIGFVSEGGRKRLQSVLDAANNPPKPAEREVSEDPTPVSAAAKKSLKLKIDAGKEAAHRDPEVSHVLAASTSKAEKLIASVRYTKRLNEIAAALPTTGKKSGILKAAVQARLNEIKG